MSYRSLLIFIITIIIGSIFSNNVMAASSCTATVSPSSVQTNTNTNFSFSITNTGTETVTTVKITRPSENFNLENYGVSGWSVNANNVFAELTGGTVVPGATFNFNYHGISGGSEASSSNWTVTTNTGSGEIICTGSLSTAISGVRDTTPPEITNVTVSNVNSSSATVNWTTNEAATSIVYYGTTTDYGSNTSGDGLTTSHNITLSSLTANTTYYFYLESADSSGNTTTLEELSFVTSETATIAEVTPIVIQTTTIKTETKTETKTKVVEIRDTLPPVVSITSDFEKPFEQAPEISGRTSDSSRIATVEYSIDGGENWLTVDEILTPGQISTEFRFIPALFDDGNYEIKVRAIDGAGNIGVSKMQTLIIDRLPPLIGASLFSLGPLILKPNENGAIVTTTGVEQKITLSAAGGPISISLFIGDSIYSLSKSIESGLWSGTIRFKSSGVYQIKYKAIDGGENKTENNLADIIVVEPGQIIDKKTKLPIKNTKVSLFQKDELTGEWYSWDGAPFNQTSPQITKDQGVYNYFLPPGQYYFKVEGPGYQGVVSQIFDISTPTPINTNFYLTKKIFPIQLNWEKVDVTLNIPETNKTENNLNTLIGKTTPEFNTLRGRPTLVTFLNSWSPSAIEQITILDNLYKKEKDRINFTGVFVQEKSSKVEVFRLRGNYSLPFLADPDGTTAQDFSVTNLPTHMILDRKGTILKILNGVFTESEILNNF